MHASRILPALAVLALLIAPAMADDSKVEWLKRIDDAQRVAAETNKDLLISFTGHGWCHFCELLDRAVFRQGEFARAAPKTFVLVEIDFAAETDEESDPAAKELRDLYATWKKEYLIDGVPVVVLADAAGKPYAYLSYYNEITAEKFLETLRKAQAARAERDTNVSEARLQRLI